MIKTVVTHALALRTNVMVQKKRARFLVYCFLSLYVANNISICLYRPNYLFSYTICLLSFILLFFIFVIIILYIYIVFYRQLYPIHSRQMKNPDYISPPGLHADEF